MAFIYAEITKCSCTPFAHLIVSLYNRFYALVLISVFDMNIHSSSLRLFKIEHVVSVLPATHRQYFILLLPLPLRWLRVTFVFEYLDRLKITISLASDTVKRDFLMIRGDISGTQHFRELYRYHLKI